MRVPLNDSVSTFNHSQVVEEFVEEHPKTYLVIWTRLDCTKLRPSLDAYTEAPDTEWKHRKLISMNQSYNNQALTTR